jgi:tetratricopeptide (TPR) repeat protein
MGVRFCGRSVRSRRPCAQILFYAGRISFNDRRNRPITLLGEAYLMNGKLAHAEKYLHEALIECRRIDLIEFEAAVLLGIARHLMAQDKWEEAKELASTALRIAQRSDLVLDETDAHLLLAELALLTNDRDLAKSHATKAQKLAVCDGLPDDTYKVAYDEARRLSTATSLKLEETPEVSSA